MARARVVRIPSKRSQQGDSCFFPVFIYLLFIFMSSAARDEGHTTLKESINLFYSERETKSKFEIPNFAAQTPNSESSWEAMMIAAPRNSSPATESSTPPASTTSSSPPTSPPVAFPMPLSLSWVLKVAVRPFPFHSIQFN